jgi:signal transduction histidine kinase
LRLFQRQSRTVLFIGFGGLLALMVFAGVDGLRVLRRMQDRSGSIQREFLERGRVLNQIRSDVYLSGTYARDYLLDPGRSAADRSKTELRRLRREMDATLANYAQLMRPEEREPLEGLRRNLNEYWQALDPVLLWGADQRRGSGYAFVRDVVIPRRRAMLSLADEIDEVNRRQVSTGNARLTDLFSEFRYRLIVTLMLTLALGSLLAVFATRRILALESQTTSQYTEVTEARGQLRSLSARLVKTQEEERRALSRELHDEVGQSLSAILVGLSNLVGATPAEVRSLVEREAAPLRRLVEGNVRTVRNLTLLLRPSMLDDLGLIPALEWQGREASRHSGLRVDISAEAVSDELPEELKTCVYRVVQEALTNVARHAEAQSVRIVVQQETARLLLSIQDDGRGFDIARSKGLGLLGMEERVRGMTGSLHVRSETGMGTLISVVLPLRTHPRGNE